MHEKQKAFYKTALAKEFCWPTGDMVFIDQADLADRGFGSGGCAFQIVWEGPFDWATQVFTNPPGFWAEAYNGFVLNVYQDGVEYGPIHQEPAKPEGLDEVAARAQTAWNTAIAAEDDAGTCTGGKGLVLAGQMNYRTTVQRLVVRANCQGNVPAQRTKHIPMKILADAGFATEYYDGWID